MEFYDAFEEQEIQVVDIPDLPDEDLQALGVMKIGLRMILEERRHDIGFNVKAGFEIKHDFVWHFKQDF